MTQQSQWRVYEILDTRREDTNQFQLKATIYAFSDEDAITQVSRRTGVPVEWLIAERVVRTYQVPQ